MRVSWSGNRERLHLRSVGLHVEAVAKFGALDHAEAATSAPAPRLRFTRGAIEMRARFPDRGTTSGAVLSIEHALRDARHVFVPHLTPEDGTVAGDAVFRAPAVVIANASAAVAFVVDVDDVTELEGVRAWLDYDHRAGRVTVGVGAYEREGHVFYRRADVACRGQRARIRIHVLTSAKGADVANPFLFAARWMWSRWGGPRLDDALPFEAAMKHVTRWAFSGAGWGKSVWQSFALDGVAMGAPVFIVDVSMHPAKAATERRWREAPSVWNQAWFSTQRAANGLLRYARQVDDDALATKARAMTEIALAAPTHDGLFPSVLLAAPADPPDWNGARWTNSDRRPPSASPEAIHLVDAAFTARALLEWSSLTEEPRIGPRISEFADRLVALQRPSGAFPGWVEPDGRVPPELAESAETAVSLALLVDLLRARPTNDTPAWVTAAKRAAAFVVSVIEDARWEDFETYYSCAPWGSEDQRGKRVARNGVYKSNTLAMAWAAEAMLATYRWTGERRFLESSLRAAGELALYQAVWDPAWLPARAHGGFGVMNADAEWNDARQSLFALLFFDLYVATGEVAWFERGRAALAASFSMLYAPELPRLARAYERRFPFFGSESYGFMMENQGHMPGDPIGEFTIYTWGNGSALASAATAFDRFGHVYWDKRRKRALSCAGIAVRVERGELVIDDPTGRAAVLVVDSDGVRRIATLERGRGRCTANERS